MDTNNYRTSTDVDTQICTKMIPNRSNIEQHMENKIKPEPERQTNANLARNIDPGTLQGLFRMPFWVPVGGFGSQVGGKIA